MAAFPREKESATKDVDANLEGEDNCDNEVLLLLAIIICFVFVLFSFCFRFVFVFVSFQSRIGEYF